MARDWKKQRDEVIGMAGQTFGSWTVLRRAGSVGGSATWLAQHSCGALHTVVGTRLRAYQAKYCRDCRPSGRAARGMPAGGDATQAQQPGFWARHGACVDQFGITWGELAMLVAVVARWRCGKEPTTRMDVAPFLASEAGLNERHGGELRDLEKRRLVRQHHTVGNVRFYEPTSTGISKVGWAGRSEAAA